MYPINMLKLFNKILSPTIISFFCYQTDRKNRGNILASRTLLNRLFTLITACYLLFLTASCAHNTESIDGPLLSENPPVLEPAIQDTSTQANEDTDNSAAQADEQDTPDTSVCSTASNAMAFGDAQERDIPGIPHRDLTPQNIQQYLDEALEYCESSQEFWHKGELESALEALDKAYALILNVETEGPPSLIQQKEDLRFLISKRILEIYASRNIVVTGNHKAIPRELNANVEKEIKLFTNQRGQEYFVEAFKRSGKYRPMILDKLAQAGLPAELSWLPLIESGFKVKAFSRARALGLWQFIPSTGYKFGLKRNQYIDERIDFEKSTDAAIAYLKELHNIFGDWTTVLAAYNCGEGRVLHVIRTQNVNYLDNFWDLYGRLPYETARYVPRFLAALHIIENPGKYGLTGVQVDSPLDFETVDVHRQVHLKDLATSLGTTFEELKALNPELRYSVLPPDKYTLRVPVGDQETTLALIDQVPLSSPPQPKFVYHRVRKGENLSSIARHYHTDMKKIMWANNLRRSSYIVVGQRLKIPQRGMVVMPASVASSDSTSWEGRHVVKRGDSLWNIANRYGTTTQKIQEMNSLSSTRLYTNQVLKVPSPQKETARSDKDSGTYYVQSGDSPYLIARKHNMSLNHFLRLNNLTSGSTIYPGQKVLTD